MTIPLSSKHEYSAKFQRYSKQSSKSSDKLHNILLGGNVKLFQKLYFVLIKITAILENKPVKQRKYYLFDKECSEDDKRIDEE